MSKEKQAGSTEVAVFSQNLPAHLQGKTGGGRGMEDVTAADIIIPRVELIQALSPARDKTHSGYIAGAEEGMMFNNVTRHLYGADMFVVPVVYRKQWLVWKDRKLGGGSNGFRGAFNSELEAKRHISELGEEGLETQETAQHFVLVVMSNGTMEEAVISMSRTKLKVSKRWNSLMRLAGGDCFERVYRLFPVVEVNARNEKFYNFNVEMVGFGTEAAYKKAEALYESVNQGRVVASQDYDDSASESAHQENEF